MKRNIALFLCIALCLFLAACGHPEGTLELSFSPAASPQPPASAASSRQEEPVEPDLPEEEAEEPAETESGPPVVYMTTDISPEGLMAVYEALGRQASGNTAVKISTGEPGSHYLDADLIKNLVQSVDGTIVECNTAYGGSRASTAYHMQLAADHGYTAIADVDIRRGSILTSY